MEVFAAPVLRTETGFRMHCIPIPADVADALEGVRIVVGTIARPGGPEVAVRRAIHGRGDGAPRLHVGKGLLREAGLAYGDTALVAIAPAPDPDAVHLPAELEAALALDPEAAARFATFTPGRRRSLGVHVDQAKRPATREKRALELCHKIRTHTLHGDRPRGRAGEHAG